MDHKYKYRVEIQQMMFVSGSTSDPPLQTIIVVEDIVRAQVVQLINQATHLAKQRSARFITVEDIMFLIRHDIAKVNRLSTYLAWKDVRKNARDQDSGGAAADGPDILDDPAASALTGSNAKSNKNKRIGLPWKIQNMFPIPMSAVQAYQISSLDDQEEDTEQIVDQDSDDEDTEAHRLMSDRLRNADLRTQNMTRDEYVHWSECRQASFTFRKGKKFRDWCGISHITDAKLQDDIMDVLGFLTFEIVANITSQALEIKHKQEENSKLEQPDKPKAGQLFKLPNMTEKPLLPEHIRMAYSKYQTPSKKARALRTWQGGMLRYNERII